MKSLLILLGFGYVAYAAVMVWLHPRFIYPFQADDVVLPGFDRIQIDAEDGTPIYVQERAGNGPVVLYFMGNAGSIVLFETAFDHHVVADRHVIALEYRGGAGRPGQPSEAKLKADALRAADYAFATGKPVIVQGFSMGTGLATHVAARRKVLGAILTAPYDRLCRLMAQASYLPACLLPVQRWNSIEDARKADVPMLVLHGDGDKLIPPVSSAGFGAIPGLRRVIIPGAGHNDIGGFPDVEREIETFISALTGR